MRRGQVALGRAHVLSLIFVLDFAFKCLLKFACGQIQDAHEHLPKYSPRIKVQALVERVNVGKYERRMNICPKKGPRTRDKLH